MTMRTADPDIDLEKAGHRTQSTAGDVHSFAVSPSLYQPHVPDDSGFYARNRVEDLLSISLVFPCLLPKSKYAVVARMNQERRLTERLSEKVSREIACVSQVKLSYGWDLFTYTFSAAYSVVPLAILPEAKRKHGVTKGSVRKQ